MEASSSRVCRGKELPDGSTPEGANPCLEQAPLGRLALLTAVITGLGSISTQNSHPSLSWVSDLKVDH